MRNTADDVREQIAYLEWLRAAVEPYVRDGQSLEQAREGITLFERYSEDQFAIFLPRSIEKVFGELSEGR